MDNTKITENLAFRKPLENNSKIELYKKEADGYSLTPTKFVIDKVENAGGSCICYSAKTPDHAGTLQSGRLKEFYPVSYLDDARYCYDLDRDADGQLRCTNGLTSHNFTAARAEYYRCYEVISELQKNKEANLYFEQVEIYRSAIDVENDNNYSYYVWSKTSTVESFGKYLDDAAGAIHSILSGTISPTRHIDLAKYLLTILEAIQSFAVGINYLHCKGFLYLDCKPDNFGIIQQPTGLAISIFDVNTVYPRNNSALRPTSGTKYFRSPEMEGRSYTIDEPFIGIPCDIFSLGATLYNAIIMKEGERKKYDYNNDFSSIGAELINSDIIYHSDINKNNKLRQSLLKMLQASLARRPDEKATISPYRTLASFAADAKEAIDWLRLLIEKEKGSRPGYRFNLTESNIEETAEKNNRTGDATEAIQYQLFEKPLYDYANEGKINILTLGCGAYGESFISLALQLAQIKDCRPDITVITNDNGASQYESDRPGLRDFFEINGKAPGKEAYGSITLIDNCTLTMDNDNRNIEKIKERIPNKKFSYVFISMSDDDFNINTAVDIAKSGIVTPGSIINFAVYGDGTVIDLPPYEEAKRKAENDKITLNPVRIYDTICTHPQFKQLEQMAFNAHLIWEGYPTDPEKQKELYPKFNSAYNRPSSFANALGVKYKLKCIGLDKAFAAAKTPEDFSALAEKCKQELPEGSETFNMLTMYEHRRWIVDRICLSYHAPTREQFDSITDSNKNDKERWHTCIVPSTEEWSLNTDFWKNLSNWDSNGLTDTEEFKKLDELDKMSVLLHRHCMTQAKERLTNEINIQAFKTLTQNLEESHELKAYEDFIISLRNKEGRDTSIKNEYDRLSSELDKVMSDQIPLAIESKKHFDEWFKSVPLAFKYIDYKAIDHYLIYGIPYILSNQSLKSLNSDAAGALN